MPVIGWSDGILHNILRITHLDLQKTFFRGSASKRDAVMAIKGGGGLGFTDLDYHKVLRNTPTKTFHPRDMRGRKKIRKYYSDEG